MSFNRGECYDPEENERGRFPRIPDVECAAQLHEQRFCQRAAKHAGEGVETLAYSRLTRNQREAHASEGRASRRALGTASAHATTSQTNAVDCAVANQEPHPILFFQRLV
jgi:hypothetical protein